MVEMLLWFICVQMFPVLIWCSTDIYFACFLSFSYEGCISCLATLNMIPKWLLFFLPCRRAGVFYIMSPTISSGWHIIHKINASFSRGYRSFFLCCCHFHLRLEFSFPQSCAKLASIFSSPRHCPILF